MDRIKVITLITVFALIGAVFTSCADAPEPNTDQEAIPDIIYNGGNYVYAVLDKNGDAVEKDVRDGIIPFLKYFVADTDGAVVSPVADNEVLIAVPDVYDKNDAVSKYESFGTLNFRDCDGNVKLDYTSVRNAEVSTDTDSPCIVINFTDKGAELLEDVTSELAASTGGRSVLGIYMGDTAVFELTVNETVRDGKLYAEDERFAADVQCATALADAINFEYSKNYSIRFSYEIAVSEEEKAQWEEEVRKAQTQAFLSAVATALTKQTGATHYAKDIDEALLEKYDSLTVVSTSDADYMILGTPEYTERYILYRYEEAPEGTDAVTKPLDAYEHLLVEYRLESTLPLELLRNLKLLDLNGGLDSYPNVPSSKAASASWLGSVAEIPNLDKIKYLSVSGSELTSLDGIESASKLEYFEATDCHLTDIKALAGLSTLKYIDLSDNCLEALDGIQSNIGLETGIFERNRLTSLSPLSSLKKLTRLYVDGNALQSLDGIQNSSQTLKRLYVRGNTSENGEKTLADISALEGFTVLEILDISDNAVTDIQCVASMTALGSLLASNNAIETVPDSLRGLQALINVDLSGNALSALGGISRLKNLCCLDVSYNKLTSVSGINALTELIELSLANNEIESLENLSKLKSLQFLDLSGNAFSALGGLGALHSVTEVDLSDNPKLLSIVGFNTVFDSSVLKKADFSSTAADGQAQPNMYIENWDPISEFDSTEFRGLPDGVIQPEV